MTRFLVTGGSGFIGSALVRRLLAAGYSVRVLDDGSRGRLRRLQGLRGDLEVVVGDVRDPSAVLRASHAVDAICHLAAVNGTAFFYSVPDRVLDVGIRGMLNVIDAARANGIRRLYLASSSEVYQTPPRVPTDERVPLTIPDPLNPRYSYAGSKIASELLLLNQARGAFDHAVIFRPHNVYGPDMGQDHVIPELILRARSLASASSVAIRLPIQGTGNETRAFCYIDDAVDGIFIGIERGEHLGIYNVGSEQETTIADLARSIGAILGRDVDILAGPPAAGATRRRCPDISRLRALGYAPSVPLAVGLAATVRWYDAGEPPAQATTA